MSLIKNLPYKLERSGNIGIFAFNGELSSEHENDLTLILMKAIHNSDRAVLNLKEVTKINSTCLQLLNTAYCTSIRLKKPLILTEVPKKYLSDMYNCSSGKRINCPPHTENIQEENKKEIHNGTFMGVRNLAEAVMLQSIEDLWNPAHLKGSKDFFCGDAFNICSELVGLDSINKFRLIQLLEKAGYKWFSKLHGA
jgi:anti-anti-sigma regulatory factor